MPTKVVPPIVASLCGLLTLTGSGCIGAVVAQEVVGQHQLAPTVPAFSEEKVKAATPGAEFKECTRGCPVMIVIPPGKFVMGSSASELDHRASEDPQHEVEIKKSFAVSKFEVTFEQWDACVAASACVPAADAWGRGDMPVVNVSWEDVHQYVGWLSDLTGKEYRLLTEAEWEYAARAGTNTRFSWGNEPGADNANCSDCGSIWSVQTAPVGSLKRAGAKVRFGDECAPTPPAESGRDDMAIAVWLAACRADAVVRGEMTRCSRGSIRVSITTTTATSCFAHRRNSGNDSCASAQRPTVIGIA
jgi:hypothetical protein